MAKIKIPNTVEKYCDDESIEDVLRYCQHSDKCFGYVGGWSVNPTNAFTEMTIFNKLANQDKGKRLRQYIISFSPKVINDPDILYQIAKDITEFFAEEYQVVFALHFDKPHPHIHIVLNTTNFRTLRKFPSDKKSYYNFFNHANRVLRKHGVNDHLEYVSKDYSTEDF